MHFSQDQFFKRFSIDVPMIRDVPLDITHVAEGPLGELIACGRIYYHAEQLNSGGILALYQSFIVRNVPFEASRPDWGRARYEMLEEPIDPYVGGIHPILDVQEVNSCGDILARQRLVDLDRLRNGEEGNISTSFVVFRGGNGLRMGRELGPETIERGIALETDESMRIHSISDTRNVIASIPVENGVFKSLAEVTDDAFVFKRIGDEPSVQVVIPDPIKRERLAVDMESDRGLLVCSVPSDAETFPGFEQSREYYLVDLARDRISHLKDCQRVCAISPDGISVGSIREEGVEEFGHLKMPTLDFAGAYWDQSGAWGKLHVPGGDGVAESCVPNAIVEISTLDSINSPKLLITGKDIRDLEHTIVKRMDGSSALVRERGGRGVLWYMDPREYTCGVPVEGIDINELLSRNDRCWTINDALMGTSNQVLLCRATDPDGGSHAALLVPEDDL